jgi:adenine deaminase
VPNERTPLHEATRELAATARGEIPATLVVRGGTLLSVTSGEILPNMSVAVRGSRIAYVGADAGHTLGDETRIVEAEGRYIAPGFLDGHCHIESSQLTVTQFARAVLPLGTTGGFFDAHEITNVLGLRGLRLMLEEARNTPLAAYMQVASCVPSTSTSLETPGAVIGPEEVAEALGWGEDVIALGEVMNFPGVVFGDEKMHGEISAALRAGKIADGHFAWPPGHHARRHRVAPPAGHVRQAQARLGLARRRSDHKSPHRARPRPSPHRARHRR